MKKFLVGVLALMASTAAMGGNFAITDEDFQSMSVHYTGTVERWDPLLYSIIAERCGNRVLILTIDSPGGDAYAGLRLYWALEAHPRLVTIAGGEMGAWSAAAIMWTAGDHQLIAEHGAVWFHSAFCQWDPEPNPEIGCDTTDFQFHLIRCLDNAGYHGSYFNMLLNAVQSAHGTDGWIGKTNDGWYMRDTTDWWFKDFNADWILND